MHKTLTTFFTGSLLVLSPAVLAASGEPVHETCPEASDIGGNATCYPVTFLSKTEIHPEGIPIIGYLFVPNDRPDEPLPAIVFAHGSGSMYSSGGHEDGGGNHNAGLNSKHKQWVKQYTSELGYVSLHVDSFHSRYLLEDTPGDQRILDIDVRPDGIPGGDDYRATSTAGGLDNPGDDLSNIPDFDPNVGGWKDQSNGGAGVSEVMERAYDMDAAWDFLAGIRKGHHIETSRNEDDRDNSHAEATLGTPAAGEGYIGEIVAGGITIDHERIFMYGTSHGGQTAMATAHASRALADTNPMNADMSEGFNGKRFAAFFDYYGGCGLHGAYGGTSDSSWSPYAPFLMLHGDHDDDAVFNDDEIPIDSPAGFAQTTCGKRIAAAKTQPGFDQFLEAIVYEGTYHSFDGVKRGDFNNEADPDFASWLAKIHANYRITVPMMEGIGRIVASTRNGIANPPTLVDYGITTENAYFHTVPLDPMLPPQLDYSALPTGGVIDIPDLRNHDLEIHALVRDQFEYFDFTCAVNSATPGVTIDPTACVLSVQMSPVDINDLLPDTMGISVSSERGILYIPARLTNTDGTTTGNLTLFQPIETLPNDIVLGVNDDGGFRTDLRSLAWTNVSWSGANLVRMKPFNLTAGLSLDGPTTSTRYFLVGPEPPFSVSGNATAALAGNGVAINFTVDDDGSGRPTFRLDDTAFRVYDSPNFMSPEAVSINYAANFVPLDPVKSNGDGEPDGPALYAQHCASCHGSLENSQRRGRTANQIRTAIANVSEMSSLSVLTDKEIDAIAAALAGDGSNPPAPVNPEPVDPPAPGSGGGGALFWLLPFMLLFRRSR